MYYDYFLQVKVVFLHMMLLDHMNVLAIVPKVVDNSFSCQFLTTNYNQLVLFCCQ